MTRYRTDDKSHTVSDRFITVACDLEAHELWGLHTFFRSESGWYESSTLQMPGGKMLNRQGEGLSMITVTGDGEVLPEVDPNELAEFDVMSYVNGDVDKPVWLRAQEPGVYSKVPIRCPRCGDNLPVRFINLTKALDLIDGTGRSFVSIKQLRALLNEVARR